MDLTPPFTPESIEGIYSGVQIPKLELPEPEIPRVNKGGNAKLSRKQLHRAIERRRRIRINDRLSRLADMTIRGGQKDVAMGGNALFHLELEAEANACLNRPMAIGELRHQKLTVLTSAVEYVYHLENRISFLEDKVIQFERINQASQTLVQMKHYHR